MIVQFCNYNELRYPQKLTKQTEFCFHATRGLLRKFSILLPTEIYYIIKWVRCFNTAHNTNNKPDSLQHFHLNTVVSLN